MTSWPGLDLGSNMAWPGIAAIGAAAARIAGEAVLTPLLESPAVNARLGGRLLIKAEPLQRTGSFKFRGAYNTLAQLSADQRGRGVVAWPSGNHPPGLAPAAPAPRKPAPTRQPPR